MIQSELVTGENAILYEYVSSNWVPYACVRSINIDFVTDVIETSVSGSGLWASFLPTKNSWTAGAEGIVAIEKAGSLSLADLRTKQFNQTLIQIKFERTNDDGDIYSETGYAYIVSSSDTGSHNDMDTFSISFRGTGAIAQIFDPNIVTAFYRVAAGSTGVCNVLPMVLYSNDPFGTGVIMYVDAGLTIPLTGKNYIIEFGGEEIYNISDTTGTVETGTGSGCP